jgi:pimeloyl-ACP methyl ester carboxylesterase
MNFLVQQQPAFVYTGGQDFQPEAPNVIFVHGAANDHSVWRDVVRQLRNNTANDGLNLLAVDLPGHGQTFAEAKSSVEAYAEWLVNFLDNGAIQAATLVGHSMGSLIALDVARRYPERVARLGLIGTALPMPVSDAVVQMVQTNQAAASDQLTRWNFYLRKNADGSFPPPTPTMQTYRNLLAAARPGVMGNDLAACAHYHLDDAAVAAINTPVAILASEHDKMVSAAAAATLCEHLPNAKLTVLSGVGHAMMQQASIDVADWINTIIEPLRPTVP